MSTREPAVDGELDWYYGDDGKMWHRGCAGGRGEVWSWKGGSYTCDGCNIIQPPEGGWE